MPPNIRFWRNLTLIGLAHVALIAGLVHWSHTASKPTEQNVVWMSGGGDGAPVEPKTNALSTPLPERPPRLFSKSEEPEDRPVLTSVESEIQLPAATPRPTPRTVSTPATSATPRRSVASVPTPKPSATAKPIKKKLVLAKASPKPVLRPKPKEADEDESEAVEKKQEKAEEPHPVQTEKVKVAQGPRGKGSSAGAGGRIGGPGGESQFGWYGSMLHDRFYSEWAQPAAVASSGEKFAVMVKLRIQRDGRVTNFEIVRSSGNSTVDESVQAVANRVTQVDPLPVGLGNGDHYDVKINFELSSE